MWPKAFLQNFITEFMFCILHPVPYLFPNKMGVLMFLRLLLLVRVVKDRSELWMKRGVIFKGGYKDRGGPPIDTILCCKTAIDKNKFVACILVLGSAVSVFSYAMFLIQREGADNGATIFHCFWSTIFMMSRGIARLDNYDSAGRMIELMMIMCGTVCVSFIVALVTITMEVKPHEMFAVIFIRKFEKLQHRRVMSAELIQACFRYQKLRKQAPEEATVDVEIYFEGLIAKHKKFRLDCEMQENLSLDPAHDKLLATERKLQGASEDMQGIKDAQTDMLEQFDLLDEKY